MPRRVRQRLTLAEEVFAPPESTVLDLIDRLLNTGAMATGDVTLGVAGVDLIYLRLSSLLCAADRVIVPGRGSSARRRRRARAPRSRPSR
jgi:hypothetical protein